MAKKGRIGCLRFFLLGTLWAGLAGMGATYAGWSDRIKIGGDFTTGVMDIKYSPDAPCRVSLVNGDGTEEEGMQEAEAVLRADGKAVDVTVPFPFHTEEFLEHPDRLIRLEFPIEAGASGTIDCAELSEADFLEEPAEELSLEPSHMVLIPEGGGKEYELSGDETSAFGASLVFDVFRETGERDGTAVGVIYLRLKEESRNFLAELPQELELEAGEADFASSDGQLVITYQCRVPVCIEQGHTDAASLQQEEKEEKQVGGM